MCPSNMCIRSCVYGVQFIHTLQYSVISEVVRIGVTDNTNKTIVGYVYFVLCVEVYSIYIYIYIYIYMIY